FTKVSVDGPGIGSAYSGKYDVPYGELKHSGLSSTLKSLEFELKNEKEKAFRVDKIIDQLQSCISTYDLSNLRDYWNFLNARLYMVSVRKLEVGLLKLYLINAAHSNKQDKILDFFERMTELLQSQPEFKEWFAFPFVRNPRENPNFALYFSQQWQDTFYLSLHNFLSIQEETAIQEPVNKSPRKFPFTSSPLSIGKKSDKAPPLPRSESSVAYNRSVSENTSIGHSPRALRKSAKSLSETKTQSLSFSSPPKSITEVPHQGQGHQSVAMDTTNSTTEKQGNTVSEKARELQTFPPITGTHQQEAFHGSAGPNQELKAEAESQERNLESLETGNQITKEVEETAIAEEKDTVSEPVSEADVNKQKCVSQWRASSGELRQLSEWSLHKTGQKIRDLPLHAGAVSDFSALEALGNKEIPMGKLLAFDSDGKYLLGCRESNSEIYQMLKSETGMRHFMTLKGHQSSLVTTLDWSPNMDTKICLAGTHCGSVVVSTLLSQ
ncbi:WDR91-like protein, partial [Mya arenaria]